MKKQIYFIAIIIILISLFFILKEEDKVYCPEEKGGDFCIQEYKPVCGWFNENIKCIKYPCAETFSNSCFACLNEDVEYWTDGECPKS